ncbi:hypothetical protein [Actinoplanes sp. NPDC020271]|uniref:hypothetical protein n=1 Tax=Actinoplanes sp. NPDC020271 TaxID=3363896 RepID=UPI003793B4D3
MAEKTARKADVLQVLRTRGLQSRADWFDRQLPDDIDILRNRSLLSTLGIDPATLAEAAPAASGPEATGPPMKA